MKAIVVAHIVEDDANTTYLQDIMMDSVIEACPEERETGDCWCVFTSSQILAIEDDETVDFKVVKLDAEDD